jgi:hypothetical protein
LVRDGISTVRAYCPDEQLALAVAILSGAGGRRLVHHGRWVISALPSERIPLPTRIRPAPSLGADTAAGRQTVSASNR